MGMVWWIVLNVCKWCRELRAGRTKVHDKPKIGRPSWGAEHRTGRDEPNVSRNLRIYSGWNYYWNTRFSKIVGEVSTITMHLPTQATPQSNSWVYVVGTPSTSPPTALTWHLQILIFSFLWSRFWVEKGFPLTMRSSPVCRQIMDQTCDRVLFWRVTESSSLGSQSTLRRKATTSKNSVLCASVDF